MKTCLSCKGTRCTWRRKYRTGKCQDCGRTRSVTTIYFWVNHMRYVVCADCIRMYRSRILTHHAPEIEGAR